MKIFIESYDICGVQNAVTTDVSPSDIRRFKPDAPSWGTSSVVYCDSKFPSKCHSGSPFTIAPNDFRVLNIGSTSHTYLIFDSSSRTEIHRLESSNNNKSDRGDSLFLEALPDSLRNIGEDLLKSIRERFSGELKFYPKSRKYVETPNNFWAVVIQPRDKSLRVTVKGRPQSHISPPDIELKPDLSSYSSFKIKSLSQLKSALAVITEAANK